MRGLTTALLARDFPGHDGNHRAGRFGVPFLSSGDAVGSITKTTTIKTTGKTV